MVVSLGSPQPLAHGERLPNHSGELELVVHHRRRAEDHGRALGTFVPVLAHGPLDLGAGHHHGAGTALVHGREVEEGRGWLVSLGDDAAGVLDVFEAAGEVWKKAFLGSVSDSSCKGLKAG